MTKAELMEEINCALEKLHSQSDIRVDENNDLELTFEDLEDLLDDVKCAINDYKRALEDETQEKETISHSLVLMAIANGVPSENKQYLLDNCNKVLNEMDTDSPFYKVLRFATKGI